MTLISEEVKSPTEARLISALQTPMEEQNYVAEKVKMKRHMGLMEGIAVILGIIFGSGNIIG